MNNLSDYSYEKLKEIIEDVRMSHQWHITRDGKIYSTYAENFLSDINLYTQYCLPENADKFKKDLRHLVYNPLVPQLVIKDKEKAEKVNQMVENNTSGIIEYLYDYINACHIAEIFVNTNSWNEVENKLHEQGHSGYTFSGLSNVLIKYFPMGAEFIDRFDPSRPKRDKDFKKYYLEAKLKLSPKNKDDNQNIIQKQ